MPRSIKAYSDWCAVVEDLQVWSSPASSSTPPCFEVPAKLPWRKTSPVRSTPGPLPYHMAKTPSCLASPNSWTCWVPQTAVAARSSLTPGWKTICFLLTTPRSLADPGLEGVVLPLGEGAGLPHCRVDPAERRPAIAGDEAGGVEPGRLVALALHHRQPDQRLGSGEEDPAAFERVFVVEADG